MIITEYLSRHCNEDEDPSGLIPVRFCRLMDVETFCVGMRASLRARGETVPEVRGVDKEMDPHMMPMQQYASKGATPKKTIHNPNQGTISKEVSRSKIDLVKVTPSQVTTDKMGKSLVECASHNP